MSIRSFSSLGRLALRGAFRAQAAAAAAGAPNSSVVFPAALGSGVGKNSSVDLYPAALGYGLGKDPHALALTSSTFGGGYQGSSVPGVPFFAMITLATFSTCYMTFGEASAKGKRAKDPEEASSKGKTKGRDGGLPASVNWVEKGAVTTPRRQGKCGSCWAHASVGAVESEHQIKTGKLIALSTQQVIDCALRKFSTGEVVVGKGCEGGNFNQAFRHIKAYGLMSAKSYPHRWLLHQGECCYKFEKVAVTIRDYGYCGPSEIELMGAVAIRPVAVSMDSCPFPLKDYSGGIIEIEDWPPASEEKDFYNHIVLVVGYGTDDDGKEYWLIKNSWGAIWGEKGYVRIRRGTGNPLGVGGIHRMHGSFPVM